MSDLVLSLFPGIGLLDHAFELEGFTVVRGPDVLWGGDVRRFHPPAGKFDGIIGGPPCQTFSALSRLVRANGHEPRFGNLIPEFERCVSEAEPAWFVMENVEAAPAPVVEGYAVKSFLLDNSQLAAGDGLGQEQRRLRRFSFGMRGVAEPPSLLRWIDLAVFFLPDVDRTITQFPVDNSAEAKRRHAAVLSDARETPVAPGGSGKLKRTLQPAVVSHSGLERVGQFGKAKRQEIAAQKRRSATSVSGSNGGNGKLRVRPGAGNGGKGRYRLADACRLQGLPEDFLADAPFTAEGKLKAVANGVPIPTGRAIAKAVREALTEVQP